MAAESGGHPLGWQEVFEGSALTTSQMPWCGVVSGSHLTTELGIVAQISTFSEPSKHCDEVIVTPRHI